MPDLLEANRAINEVYARIGARIAKTRKSADLTQTDLGMAVGLSRSSIANVESGVQRPPLHIYLAIAQGFGVSLADLVGDAELPKLADRVPGPGALVVKRARAVLTAMAGELMRMAASMEDVDV